MRLVDILFYKFGSFFFKYGYLKADCSHGICSSRLLGMLKWKNHFSSRVQDQPWQVRHYTISAERKTYNQLCKTSN